MFLFLLDFGISCLCHPPPPSESRQWLCGNYFFFRALMIEVLFCRVASCSKRGSPHTCATCEFTSAAIHPECPRCLASLPGSCKSSWCTRGFSLDSDSVTPQPLEPHPSLKSSFLETAVAMPSCAATVLTRRERGGRRLFSLCSLCCYPPFADILSTTGSVRAQPALLFRGTAGRGKAWTLPLRLLRAA